MSDNHIIKTLQNELQKYRNVQKDNIDTFFKILIVMSYIDNGRNSSSLFIDCILQICYNLENAKTNSNYYDVTYIQQLFIKSFVFMNLNDPYINKVTPQKACGE